MQKLVILYFILTAIPIVFSQSKTEQIINLTSRIDSLKSVVHDQNNQLILKAIEIERLNNVISVSDVKIKSLNKRIDSLVQIADSSRLKNELNGLYSGEWCNIDNWDKLGEYFNIIINIKTNGEGKATYTQGGPFEERYKANVTAEGTLELYWEGVGGSISFNEISQSNETCKKLTALLKILDNETIEVVPYKNDCAYLSRNIILKKLKENETCTPY